MSYFKILFFWTVLLWSYIAEGKKCPGKCISPEKCKETGGKILAYCTNSKACCGEPTEVVEVCNQNKWNAKEAYFKSPNYPELHNGSLVCQFQLNLFPSTIGVQIEFLDLYLPLRPGSEYIAHKKGGGIVCDSDMFFIRGFSDWMPDAKCGNLTGQSTVLELEEKQHQISLLMVMSSWEYKWNIKLRQVSSTDVQRLEKCWNRKIDMWNKEIGEEYHYNPVSMNISSEMNNQTLMSESIRFLDGDDEHYTTDFIGPLPLVVNGEIAQSEEIPWQISIQEKVSDLVLRKSKKANSTKTKHCPYENGEYRHVCGGTIIGDQHILTASHCVTSREPFPTVKPSRNLRIHIGDFDFCSLNETTNFAVHEVEKIIYHFNYIVPMTSNDVALIKLKKKINFGKSVRAIPLAPISLEELEYENTTNFLLSGWGNMRKVNLRDPYMKPIYPTKMRKTTKLTIVDLEECNEPKYYEYAGIENGTAEEAMLHMTNKYATSFLSWICTSGVKDGTPSFGDSGGPLVALNEDWMNPYLIGVVSHLQQHTEINEKGKKVTRNTNFFAKVTSYLNWIFIALDGEC